MGAGGADKLLLTETFEAAAPGSRPASWQIHTDDGNDAVVAEAPKTGGRCLKLTRRGGTVWKPMVGGKVMGEPESPLRFECDWYLAGLADSPVGVLLVTMRGEGNIETAQVAIGGPGGVAVPQEGGRWAPFGFPVRAGQWGHLSIHADPIARRAKGAFDVVVTQGKERMVYPNIPFRPNWQGDYAGAWWHTPTFRAVGGSPAAPSEALVDNVRVVLAPPREDE